MENQQTLFKGELMEELLRSYFMSIGFYTARGVKLRYQLNDLTDVDLFLYSRSSSLTRQRINVDIKNKKSPQAFERIIWANGLMKILNFDSCIVATTDTRPVVHTFGQNHNTTILDGAFLKKLRSDTVKLRYCEEELLDELSNHRSYKTFQNKDWRFIYELSKSRLLTEMDFSGFNETLRFLSYFLEKSLADEQKRSISIRMSYIILSHLLIIIDFIIKDIAFLEQTDREKKLSDGFKFGNLGRDGVDKIISMAVHISGNKSAHTVRKALENVPTDILKDFFSKNENAKSLFNWAREFENLGYSKDLVYPEKLDVSAKGVLSVLLDFMGIERKRYFETLIPKVVS